MTPSGPISVSAGGSIGTAAVSGGAKKKGGKRLLPPPPPGTSKAAGTATGTTYSSTPAPEYIAPLINEATKATNAQGKQGIGSGGFSADLSIGNKMDNLIEKNISDRLSGKSPTFSDEIMQMQKEKLFRETQGQTRRGRMSLMADAARRGVFRSEATGTLVRDIEIAGMQQYSSGVKDLMIKKAEMDHEDMVQAVRDGQQWLQGLRQYSLGLEQNAISREQIKATLAAAAMQAAASMYAADQGLKGSRAIAGASRAAAQQAYQDSRAVSRGPNGEVVYREHSMAQENFMSGAGG